MPLLVLIAALAVGFGSVISDFIASQGHTIPITGWLTGLLMLALSGVLLALGLPVRRYMKESQERHEQQTFAPRKHQIDLPTAYRTIVFARACAYTGAIIGGAYGGVALFLETSGTGSFAGATLPTLFAAVTGIVLGVLGVIVERWGKLPPEEGEARRESSTA